MWNKLSMADRAKIIKLGVDSGITDLNVIRNHYNTFDLGGNTSSKDRRYKLTPTIVTDETGTYADYGTKRVKIDTNVQRSYAADVNRANNPTILDELIVTAPSMHKQAAEARKELAVNSFNRNQERLDRQFQIVNNNYDYTAELVNMMNENMQDNLTRAEIDSYDNTPAYNAAYTSYMNDPQFIHHRNLEKADERVRRTAFTDDKTLNLALNFMTPGQQYRAIKDSEDLGDYWESLRNGNSGWVSQEYARRNPKRALLFNLLGDAVTGGALGTVSRGKNIVRGLDMIDNISNQSKHLAKVLYRSKLPYINMSPRSMMKIFDKDLGVDVQAYKNDMSRIINNDFDRNLNNIGASIKDEFYIRFNPDSPIAKSVVEQVKDVKPSRSYTFENPITGTTSKQSTLSPIHNLEVSTDMNSIRHSRIPYFLVEASEKAPKRASNKLSQEIESYVQDVNQVMEGKGIVGGSSVVYGKGYSVGAPNDLEIVTTQKQLNEVANKLGITDLKKHGDYGYKGRSKYDLNGELTDIQIIAGDERGAYGPLATEYYKLLYPEEYKRILDENLNKLFAGERINTNEIRLPISADELYSKITPEVQERKLLADMFGSDQIKHVERSYQALINENPVLRQQASQAFRKVYKDMFGKDFKFGSDKFTNIDFTDVKQNEEFLKFLGIDDVELATDPDIMKDLFDRWYQAQTTQSRALFLKKGDEVYIKNRDVMDKALRTIYAPFNDDYSGIGGNTIIYNGKGGVGGDLVGIMSQDLTLYPEKIHTISDVVNQYKRLKALKDEPIYTQMRDLEHAARDAKNPTPYLQEKELLAKDNDVPVYLGKEYGSSYNSNKEIKYYAGNNTTPTTVGPIYVQGDYGTIPAEVGGTGLPRRRNINIGVSNDNAASVLEDNLDDIEKARTYIRSFDENSKSVSNKFMPDRNKVFQSRLTSYDLYRKQYRFKDRGRKVLGITALASVVGGLGSLVYHDMKINEAVDKIITSKQDKITKQDIKIIQENYGGEERMSEQEAIGFIKRYRAYNRLKEE